MFAEPYLFTYADNDGNVQVLNCETAKEKHAELVFSGWSHTSTIDPRRWIEKLCLLDEDEAIEELRSLKYCEN